MAIRPLSDRIVIERVAAPTTSSLLVIPDTVASEAPIQGKVVAVGPGRWEKGAIVPMVVQPGDTVVFPKNTGGVAKVNGKEYIMMRESDILAIVGS